MSLNYAYKFHLENKLRFDLHFVASALPAALQVSLGLSDLCCFCENMTELSPELRQLELPCE
ncbi:hypothetical protein T10_12326 [Trichinella papuae]|uniref:Uncharacterized protein n=1 Tax=Trichinella papuae TaxID=268474 RepID=A0A0V1N9W2_9BILA|nr:hypothetical protein T10_12326 [Trichinella papuae]